jgi:hypothetical protein
VAGRGEDLRSSGRYRTDHRKRDGDRFHADIAEVVHTHLNEEATTLVVEWWTPTHRLRRIERE